MRNMLRLAALVGALVISLFATSKPSYAAAECSAKDGSACSQQGARSFCQQFDETEQTLLLYPCWCDRLSGPLLWRCGPNSCQVDPYSCGWETALGLIECPAAPTT